MIKLNLGCGNKILDGYENYDIIALDKRIKFIDLEEPLPFSNNYADEILLDNVIEHIENILLLMNELKRVIKPDGKIIIYVPYFRQVGAYRFNHKHFFCLSNLFQITDMFKHKEIELLFLFNERPLAIIIEIIPYLIYKINSKLYEYYVSGIVPASKIKMVLKK